VKAQRNEGLTDGDYIVHLLADNEEMRAGYLLFARMMEERLRTCDTALSRDVPKVEIVREVLQQLADMTAEQIVALTKTS
jgi:hypothetical protein